jgi:cytochrome c
MKSIIVSVAVAAGLMMAGSAMAVDMPADGKAKCGACHKIDSKLVGPAWKDVAKKYAGDKDAATKIAASVTKGGAFGWKMGVMPAKGLGANDAQIAALAKFIAELK